jgi:hypothetical protein
LEEATRRNAVKHFPTFAKIYLKIRTKNDGIQPFVLNSAQLKIHEIASKMEEEKGYIRVIILKGRQQGASTYIEGRFYWKVTNTEGKRAFILTHEGEATKNLFDMAKRFHEKMPDGHRPSTNRDSGNELSFDKLDSGYRVGTAGSKDVGRSSTIQYFHGSEVAFWEHAQEHARGIMQAIPRGTGEVWLESTSDGVGNYFAQMWRGAEQGLNDFVPIFVPWFIQDEYQSEAIEFVRTAEEEEYAHKIKAYHGYEISDEQLAFRRHKINNDFGGEEESFRREYPATPQEAFESAGVSQLIASKLVIDALHCQAEFVPVGARVLGVDCARFGDDRTVVYYRMGRYAKKCLVLQNAGQMEIVGHLKQILDYDNYDRCFIDVGMGVGVIDRLREMGYDEVQAVDFGGKPLNPDKYTNKRNEMYGELLEWLKDGPCRIDDDSDETLSDLCSVHYKFDSKNRKVLEAKADTKKRLSNSPDCADALALTFAEPVAVWRSDMANDGVNRPTAGQYDNF